MGISLINYCVNDYHREIVIIISIAQKSAIPIQLRIADLI